MDTLTSRFTVSTVDGIKLRSTVYESGKPARATVLFTAGVAYGMGEARRSGCFLCTRMRAEARLQKFPAPVSAFSVSDDELAPPAAVAALIRRFNPRSTVMTCARASQRRSPSITKRLQPVTPDRKVPTMT